MGWRRRHRFESGYQARPKMRRLGPEERQQTLARMTGEIERSPVLTAFRLQPQPLRGRFYLQWQHTEDAPPRDWGRITPVDDDKSSFLLEVEHRKGRWSEFAKGSPVKLMRAVAGDSKGTFHGLGALDKSLRSAQKQGVERLPVKKSGRKFVYSDTDAACTVQEALYHYFGLPIPVIAQPAQWYIRHRTPHIVECSKDRTRILVRFLSTSRSGETFGGTCLYLETDGEWGAYTIKPSESTDIDSAERWLVKRKWKPW